MSNSTGKSKVPNPAWSFGGKARVLSHDVTKDDLSKFSSTAATDLSKRVISDSPQSLVTSIYELKQTVYDLAQHVCRGGSSDQMAVALSGGVKMRVVHENTEASNPQQCLQELQSRVQDLFHKIETAALTDGHSTTPGTTIIPDVNVNAKGPALLTWKFPVFWAHIHMDSCVRDIAILAPGEAVDSNGGRASQFQVYRAITVHAREMLESLRCRSMKSKAVLSALRAFLSRYENLFTAPCCVCGDLLKMEARGMMPPCVRTESGSALHSSCVGRSLR